MVRRQDAHVQCHYAFSPPHRVQTILQSSAHFSKANCRAHPLQCAGAQASCRSLRISGFTHERLTVNMRPEIYSSAQCPVAKHSMCSTAPQCQNVCWQVREREGVLPPAIFPALAAFQQHTALQKMQAGLLTSASLLCSCRQTYALIFYFSFFFLNEFGQSFQ